MEHRLNFLLWCDYSIALKYCVFIYMWSGTACQHKDVILRMFIRAWFTVVKIENNLNI